jgi:hypothetical protein
MSLTDWLLKSMFEARANHDAERTRLFDLIFDASNYRYTHPERTLAMYREARALAETLAEAWLVMYIEHWTLQTLLYSTGDCRTALELAAKATVEVRKPQYDQLPQRICLHEDLIGAYLYSDPAGYTAELSEAFDYMEREISPDYECRMCLQSQQISFAICLDRIDEGRDLAQKFLAMSQKSVHHTASALAQLCEIAYRRQDFKNLSEWAVAGEGAARKNDASRLIAEFLAWQAAAARRNGDEKQAASFYQKAAVQAGTLGAILDAAYYDALCDYHESAGEHELALRLRERELAGLIGKGKTYAECQCRLKQLRLLSRLGRPVADELANAREAASRLRNPAPILEQIDTLGQGGLK